MGSSPFASPLVASSIPSVLSPSRPSRLREVKHGQKGWNRSSEERSVAFLIVAHERGDGLSDLGADALSELVDLPLFPLAPLCQYFLKMSDWLAKAATCVSYCNL